MPKCNVSFAIMFQQSQSLAVSVRIEGFLSFSLKYGSKTNLDHRQHSELANFEALSSTILIPAQLTCLKIFVLSNFRSVEGYLFENLLCSGY
jgi:hypothetical protein